MGLTIPSSLWEQLYSYQHGGVRWLWDLHNQAVGGVLGDEMGLGKTLQIITFLAGLHSSGILKSAALICVPATLLTHWIGEFHRWYPPMRIFILHESSRTMRAGVSENQIIVKAIRQRGVLLCTYGAMRTKKNLRRAPWQYVVLDEGEGIKNHEAITAKAIKSVKTPHRILMTGTPMQNNLTELHSLFDFVYPGLLGTVDVFETSFAAPIRAGGYKHTSSLQVQLGIRCAMALRELIKPYLLRRLKKDVATSLPKKTEQVLFCDLTECQIAAYREILESDEMEEVMRRGRGKRDCRALGLITKLRKICNHADLVNDDIAAPLDDYGSTSRSTKMRVLEKLLPLWHRQGHRVLIFAVTKQVLTLIEICVRELGLRYLRMDGSRPPIHKRQGLIDTFNTDSGISVFLLTTAVGGIGVNLTGADRVIIFEPHWNPSKDMQARERSWRVGQTRAVTVFRLICNGTIEEKIYHRQIHKLLLTNKVLQDPNQRRVFSAGGLYDLFTLSVGGRTFGPRARQLRRFRGRATMRGARTETGALFRGGEIRGGTAASSSSVVPSVTQSGGGAAADGNESKSVLSVLLDGDDVRSAFNHDVVERTDNESSRRVTEISASRMAAANLRALQRSSANVESGPLSSAQLLRAIGERRRAEREF